jgi:hypothetical protein
VRGHAIPKVVKIDVEGYEYLVLKGLSETLSNKYCSLLCCEIHKVLYPAGIVQEDILELVQALGFEKIYTYLRGEELHIIAIRE